MGWTMFRVSAKLTEKPRYLPADNGPSSQVQYIYKRLIIKAFTEEPRGTDAFSKPKVG